MARGAGGRTFKTRKLGTPTRNTARKASFAMLLIRVALVVLVVLALIWAANQAMFFLFREGLY